MFGRAIWDPIVGGRCESSPARGTFAPDLAPPRKKSRADIATTSGVFITYSYISLLSSLLIFSAASTEDDDDTVQESDLDESLGAGDDQTLSEPSDSDVVEGFLFLKIFISGRF